MTALAALVHTPLQLYVARDWWLAGVKLRDLTMAEISPRAKRCSKLPSLLVSGRRRRHANEIVGGGVATA